MEPEDDVGDEGADHGRPHAPAPHGRIAYQIVDARGSAVYPQVPPGLRLLGFLGGRVALDPADVPPIHRGDPVLRGVSSRRAVVADDGLPRDVVALPPPDDAGFVEPAVQRREVGDAEPAEGDWHGLRVSFATKTERGAAWFKNPEEV